MNLGPRPGPLARDLIPKPGVIVDSLAAHTLASKTIVRGIVAIRVRYASPHAHTCASEACPLARLIEPNTVRVRVTYTDHRPGESFHLSCYRHEFIA